MIKLLQVWRPVSLVAVNAIWLMSLDGNGMEKFTTYQIPFTPSNFKHSNYIYGILFTIVNVKF